MIGASKRDTTIARLSCGMVGGGGGAVIGEVSRKALVFDGKARLVGGSFLHVRIDVAVRNVQTGTKVRLGVRPPVRHSRWVTQEDFER